MTSPDERGEGTPTVVTITPIAVERDSRSFKQAASVARFGYTSIVLEGEASDLNPAVLPFELRSLGLSKPLLEPTGGQSASRGKTFKTLAWSLIRRVLGPFREIIRALLYMYDRVVAYDLPTLRRAPKASLYYLHSFAQFPAVYLLCRRYNARYIYDAHDFYSRIEETDAPDMTQRLEKWVESQCIKNAAAVVTVGEGIARLQQQTFGCTSVVIRNCQDPRLNTAPGKRIREEVGVGRDGFLLVVVGQAKTGQAVLEMLEAVALLPSEIHVALLGRRYEGYQERIQALRLEGRVHLVPPVKPSEVVPFIETADASMILYYPHSVNYRFALPNGLFQSISAGLPLLYPMNLPEITAIAEHYGLGLPIDPRSPESICAAVRTFLQEPTRLSEYTQNARRARQVLTWEQEERILRDVIQQALNPCTSDRERPHKP